MTGNEEVAYSLVFTTIHWGEGCYIWAGGEAHNCGVLICGEAYKWHRVYGNSITVQF